MNQKSRPSALSATAGIRLHNAVFMLFVLAATLASVSCIAETFRSPWQVALLSFGCGLSCTAVCKRGMGFISGRHRKSLLLFSAPASPDPKRAVDFPERGIWQDIDANRDLRRLLLERMRVRPGTKLRTAAVRAPRRRRPMPAHAAGDAREGE